MCRQYMELLHSIPIYNELDLTPTVINTENQSGIEISTNNQVSEHNKNIELKVQYIRRQMDFRETALHHINTYENPANIITKSVQWFVL